MQILLENLSKRYQREWVFKNLNVKLSPGNYAVTGPNGSGKSTLIQIISGALLPTKGEIRYQVKGVDIQPEQYYKYIAFVAPYVELVEEFTTMEFLKFNFRFKKLAEGQTLEELVMLAGLKKAINKRIKYFSSGMKQRLKLAIAFFSDVPVILLDEPASNLDQQGIAWYRQMVKNLDNDNKLLIIASNQKQEYDFCDEEIYLNKYK